MKTIAEENFEKAAKSENFLNSFVELVLEEFFEEIVSELKKENDVYILKEKNNIYIIPIKGNKPLKFIFEEKDKICQITHIIKTK